MKRKFTCVQKQVCRNIPNDQIVIGERHHCLTNRYKKLCLRAPQKQPWHKCSSQFDKEKIGTKTTNVFVFCGRPCRGFQCSYIIYRNWLARSHCILQFFSQKETAFLGLGIEIWNTAISAWSLSCKHIAHANHTPRASKLTTQLPKPVILTSDVCFVALCINRGWTVFASFFFMHDQQHTHGKANGPLVSHWRTVICTT